MVKTNASLLLLGGATVQAFVPGMLLSPQCGSFTARGACGVGAAAVFGKDSMSLRSSGSMGHRGRTLVRLAAAKKGGGGKNKPKGSKAAKGGASPGDAKAPGAPPAGTSDAAKAAATAAEGMNLLDEDEDEEEFDEEDGDDEVNLKSTADKARFDASTERMSKFDAAIQLEKTRKVSTPKSGMDGRGVSQGGFLGRGVDTKNVEDDTEASFDDSNIRELLQGKKKVSKKELREQSRIKTETGEELLLSEFAPGASISSFARPDNVDSDFDPMNMPLPSEIAARRGQAPKNDFDDFIPLPSEIGSASRVNLYTDIASGVQDESLFRIKSVFDKTGGVTPGKSDIPASGEYSARKAAADRMMQSDTFRAPREAMVGMVDEDEEEEESSIAKLGKAAGGIGQTVNRAISTIVAFDFFVVLFFLGWLVVSIIYQFAVCGELTREGGPVCNNPVYTQWYALWTPVIQPLLGILFAGTIAQATINGISSVGKDDKK